MFETLKKLFENKRIDIENLEKAVLKGWITEEQKKEIIL